MIAKSFNLFYFCPKGLSKMSDKQLIVTLIMVFWRFFSSPRKFKSVIFYSHILKLDGFICV